MIDFEKEFKFIHQSNIPPDYLAWGRSIAQRVEEEVITQFMKTNKIGICVVDRLYAPDTRDTKGEK